MTAKLLHTGEVVLSSVAQMQTTFLFVISVAIVAISFALTLSCLDHGIVATVSEVIKYIDP